MGWFEDAWNTVVNAVEDAVEDVVEWVEEAAEDVVEWTRQAKQDVVEWTRQAKQDVVESTRQAKQDVGQDVGQDLEDAAEWTLNALDDVVFDTVEIVTLGADDIYDDDDGQFSADFDIGIASAGVSFGEAGFSADASFDIAIAQGEISVDGGGLSASGPIGAEWLPGIYAEGHLDIGTDGSVSIGGVPQASLPVPGGEIGGGIGGGFERGADGSWGAWGDADLHSSGFFGGLDAGASFDIDVDPNRDFTFDAATNLDVTGPGFHLDTDSSVSVAREAGQYSGGFESDVSAGALGRDFSRSVDRSFGPADESPFGGTDAGKWAAARQPDDNQFAGDPAKWAAARQFDDGSVRPGLKEAAGRESGISGEKGLNVTGAPDFNLGEDAVGKRGGNNGLEADTQDGGTIGRLAGNDLGPDNTQRADARQFGDNSLDDTHFKFAAERPSDTSGERGLNVTGAPDVDLGSDTVSGGKGLPPGPEPRLEDDTLGLNVTGGTDVDSLFKEAAARQPADDAFDLGDGPVDAGAIGADPPRLSAAVQPDDPAGGTDGWFDDSTSAGSTTPTLPVEPVAAPIGVGAKVTIVDPFATGSIDPFATGSIDPIPTGSIDPFATGSIDPFATGQIDPFPTGVGDLDGVEAAAPDEIAVLPAPDVVNDARPDFSAEIAEIEGVESAADEMWDDLAQ